MASSSMQIIYLNGPSSSGKTTLAKELQRQLDEPYLHLGIDKIIGWMPDKVNAWEGGPAREGFSWLISQDADGETIKELQQGPYAQKVVDTYRQLVPFLAGMGHCLIVDDVSFSAEEVALWRQNLADFRVLWVRVDAPLPVLEQRERHRGNRMLGSARAQFHKMSANVAYDLYLDTHHDSLQDNVQKILNCLM